MEPQPQERQAPLWIPLPPPQPSTPLEHVLFMVRRYAFAIVATLVALALFGFFFFYTPSHDPRFEFDAALAAAQEQPPATPAVPPSQAVLSVLSTPGEATVYIDFDSVGTTPLYHTLRAGAYILRVQKPNYAGRDTVVILDGNEATTLSFMLMPADTAATMQDTAATVQDAAALAETEQPPPRPEPERPRQATPEADEPEAARAEPPPRTREAAAEAPPREEEEVPAAGSLWLASEPPGASIWLDDRRVGVTPLALNDVPAGAHEVTLRMEGYEPYTTRLDLRAGQLQAVSGNLTRMIGALSVLVRPWGSIYIDGALHKRDTDVQYETQLSAGTHIIKVVHPSLGVLEQVVKIDPNDPQRVVFDFNAAANR